VIEHIFFAVHQVGSRDAISGYAVLGNFAALAAAHAQAETAVFLQEVLLQIEIPAGLGKYPLAVVASEIALQMGCSELLQGYAVHLILAGIIVHQTAGIASRQGYAPLAEGGRVIQKGYLLGFAEQDSICPDICRTAVLNPAEPAVLQGYAPLAGAGLAIDHGQPLRSYNSKSLF